MADGFRIRIDTKQIEKLAKDLNTETRRFVDKRTADRMGAFTRNQIRQLTARGISPITGSPFPAYKNPERYPGNRKPSTPVNLRLTREFMASLSYQSSNTSQGWSPEISYRGTNNQLKEQGHREGANGQPKRPTIPEGGETFTDTILDGLGDILERRINLVLQRLFEGE